MRNLLSPLLDFPRPASLRTKGQHALGFLALVLATLTFQGVGRAGQQSEPTLPLSQRLTMNLGAGVPGYIANAASGTNAPQSQWYYQNTNDSATYSNPSLVESTDGSAHWQQVGLPYDANVTRTFINQTSGGGQGSLTGNQNWYRLHFKVDSQYAGRKFLLNLEGTHTGVQVFINGTLLPGISAVTANAKATHVVGFVPVVVDLTPYLHADGQTDNVIAIDVSRGSNWFEEPGFSGAFRFGQAMAGLFRNVFLYVTNPVHVPLNVYSNTKTWGTYVGTKSIAYNATATATADSAVVEVQTNVLNESTATQQVTLTTQIVDANGNVVVTAAPMMRVLAPMAASSFPSTPDPMFDQQITVPNPTLWYPNSSIYGKPYLYKIYHIVSVNGVVVDSTQSPLGIRIITWDNNFPYFNGHQQYLWGGSGRYDYPALGSSVPDEQQWRDLAQFAASGGNIWRPGHSTSSEEFVAAADAYGIMIDQPSGDGEGSFNNPSADDQTLKQEIHRDMIIRDRSHPSILDWEEDNGGNNPTLAAALGKLGTDWDAINPRQQASRAYDPSYAFIDECDGAGCESGNKQQYPHNPAFGAEYWDNVGTGRGLAYDFELAYAAPYLNDWRNGRANNTFGMAQWYFADTPGEVSLWAEYQNQPSMSNFVRSLGYSMVDQNRFPRILYYIYQAVWTPYTVKPVVRLAHHWNRAYGYVQGTPIQENAFSNCPAVRLLINGVAKDPLTGAQLADQTPNPWNINSSTNLTQNTTVIPGQVHWMVNYAPGTVTAQCLDTSGNVVPSAVDARTTAGSEYKIVLIPTPELTRPDGSSFQWTSNGSDAAFVTAEVVDQNGNIVPTAADNVTFSVSGPASYMGGTQQLVADPSLTNYYQDAFSKANSTVVNGVPYAFFHSPGDPELNFEGGLQKIALRSTFTPGTVTVTASAPGLISGQATLTSVAPPALVQTQAPAIIVPPVNTSVTAGYPATFTVAASGSGALAYQWYAGGTAVSGATGTSYTTAATTLQQNNTNITVVVSSLGGYGSVTSNPAVLSVSSPKSVAITAQPQPQSATVGQTATLTVVASGSPQLNYQWFENGSPVQNGPANTYTTPVLATAETDSYYVIVSNPINQVQSATVAVTVAAPVPVSFTSQPQGQIVPSNQPVLLTATVAGSAPFTYQWQFTPAGGSTTILIGATQISSTISYTIPAMTASNVGAYTVTVKNPANIPVTSAAAQLTLAPPGINLALDMPATASSTQGACTVATTAPPYSGLTCLGAENAFDGNLSTRWASASAGAPPSTTVPGVDGVTLQVDLGHTQSFNTVVLNWENAYASQYLIQYTNGDPAVDANWLTAYTNNAGGGGTETLVFQTVQGRYIRLKGVQRATQYGYSLYEFQVYNVPQCGGSNERYTPNTTNLNLIMDNLLGLTWTRTIKTNTATGSQFTGVDAANYCASINMRVPTQAEALGISGNNNASCAFPGTWNTWTSTVDPLDANETALVNFDGTSLFKVTVNWPGAVLCAAGTFTGSAPVLITQPASQTVAVGQSAMFTVMATGMPSPTYQWYLGTAPIAGATGPTYITPATVAADNASSFKVVVTNGTGSVTSNAAVLTIGTANNPAPPADPTQPTGPTNPGTVTTPRGSPTNPPNPVIPAGPANSGNGNTNASDTEIPGFGTGPSPTGPNLALGKPATSTGDEGAGSPASSAVDGNASTRWSSLFNNASDMQVDLGSVQQVGQVALRWERSYGFQYQIRVSVDGKSWTPVFTQTAGLGGSENLVFPSVSARYVQFYGIQRSSQYGYSLWEMEVYGPVLPVITTQPVSQTVTAGASAQFSVVASGYGTLTYQWLLNGAPITGATGASYTTGALSAVDSNEHFSVVVSSSGASVTSSVATLTVTNPVVGTQNLALYRPATSSGDESPNLAALYAVDGNLNTRWSSAFVDNAWLQIDMGTPTLMNKAVLFWENAYGKSYILQASNDGQTWTNVYTQTAGAGGVETLTFPAVVDRYFRLQGVQRATSYGYSIFEFQVYGADVPTITFQPSAQTVPAGSSATFNVAATSNTPLTYQWLRNGMAIGGATAASYTVPSVVSADSGSTFAVKLTNSAGVTTSASAVLTVTSPTPAGPNLALNRPTTSSSTQDQASLGSQLAVDGRQSTRWASASIDPSSITVDLGSPQTINQVILNWENAYGKAYLIRVSNDAQTWTPVFTQNSGLGGTENLSFAPVSGRYVQMYGTVRGTPYGYSLYELQVYGPKAAGAVSITTQPANQSAAVGSTATFSVTAGGTGPFTYQWMKNGSAIAGGNAATYTTPVLSTTDNGGSYTVVVGNSAGTATVTSQAASLAVANYAISPGTLGVDLVNNTSGKWADNQVFVTIIGQDPNHNHAFAYVNLNGAIVDFTVNDNIASNHLTGPDGKAYGNYSFTLAQAKSLKLPPLGSARAFISLGAPLYAQVNGDASGKVTGYAGPNPQNTSDPNLNTHFDWYEFNYALNNDGTSAVYINTTQVDEFGLPLVLDVWGSGGSFHRQVGVTESIAQLDSEFAAQVPAAFQPARMSDLRIFSPARVSLGTGGANATYFDKAVATAWTSYAKSPLSITLSGRNFTGTASGSTLTFSEVSPSSQHAGETFVIQQPSTQDILGCAGTLANGVPITAAAGTAQQASQIDQNNVQLQLQNQICSAANRGILLTPSSNWTNVAAYYGASPANFYSGFWHQHSIGALAYGFAYDDNNNQSTTISTGSAEHMTFTIGW